jgi:hypothetical protein
MQGRRLLGRGNKKDASPSAALAVGFQIKTLFAFSSIDKARSFEKNVCRRYPDQEVAPKSNVASWRRDQLPTDWFQYQNKFQWLRNVKGKPVARRGRKASGLRVV